MAIGKFAYFLRVTVGIWEIISKYDLKKKAKRKTKYDLVSEIHLTMRALWERYLHEIKASKTHFVSTASHT